MTKSFLCLSFCTPLLPFPAKKENALEKRINVNALCPCFFIASKHHFPTKWPTIVASFFHPLFFILQGNGEGYITYIGRFFSSKIAQLLLSRMTATKTKKKGARRTMRFKLGVFCVVFCLCVFVCLYVCMYGFVCMQDRICAGPRSSTTDPLSLSLPLCVCVCISSYSFPSYSLHPLF
ncbi:hypothetical protein K457DRAFT_795584 [Linnemannia elongata AG-77]|uniref:Uncharacterized protein n=1 Tax=Linnemannia elongata AG-77 TaxID=1314771 RepID=A0A197JKV1_9FUNG|nr:hypothetical protein K457DRAFT_795584 [Linnemannia elongata AG-77]